MPILQYVCKNCKKSFEELVKKYDEAVFCPNCGGIAERSYCGAMFSATGKPAKKCSGHCSTCSGKCS